MNDQEFKYKINKDDRELLSLAVKCKFIDTDQEKEVLGVLASNLNEPSLSLSNILKGLNILSEDEISFLLSIKKHIKDNCLDVKFGRIAVANHITSQDVVNKALDQQVNHFKKTREHLLIGDLLVKGHKISETDKIAILLTQDRIQDEFLEKAINELASNELEKIEINKRFGSIAVKNGLVSLEDVNKALKIQNNEKENGIKVRFLGQILEESFGLSHKDTVEILKEQKFFEKRRLDLEKALFKFISEVKANQKISQLFDYYVTKDKLEAYLCMKSEPSDDINVSNIINWIKLMGVQYGIVNHKKIEQFLNEGTEGSKLKIAQGRQPETGKDAEVELYFDPDKKVSIENTERFKEYIVSKGKVLAKVSPHTEGKSGKNVFGHILSPPELNTHELRCGRGVASKDNLIFVARSEGFPALYNNTLFIQPVSDSRKTIRLSCDITEQVKDSYQKVNLEINGTIKKNARIKCQNLSVSGDICGNVYSAGDIEISGKVGDSDIKKADQGGRQMVFAQGNVCLSKSVTDCKVSCGRTFASPNADIISSEVCASTGIYCKNVLSKGSHNSVLRFGKITNYRLLDIMADIKQKQNVLTVLKKESELNEIDTRLYRQRQVQDEFRERQQVLVYLSNMFSSVDLSSIDVNDSGFDFWEKTGIKNGSNDVPEGNPEKTKAYAYLQKIMDQIENLSHKAQVKTLKKLSEENYGMYKAATEAAVKVEQEYSINKQLIEKKIDENRSDISKQEIEINKLILERDYILVRHNVFSIRKTPEIKVKNELSEGTIIEGKASKLKIDKTIYGVRIFEKIDPKTKRAKIEISGFFE